MPGGPRRLQAISFGAADPREGYEAGVSQGAQATAQFLSAITAYLVCLVCAHKVLDTGK